jgi:hypothetical protein
LAPFSINFLFLFHSPKGTRKGIRKQKEISFSLSSPSLLSKRKKGTKGKNFPLSFLFLFPSNKENKKRKKRKNPPHIFLSFLSQKE